MERSFPSVSCGVVNVMYCEVLHFVVIRGNTTASVTVAFWLSRMDCNHELPSLGRLSGKQSCCTNMQEFLVRVLHVILVFLSELLRHALYRKTHLTLLFQHLYVNYNELDAYHDLVFVSCKVSTSQYFPYFTLSAAQPQRCRAVNTLHFNPFVRSTSAVSFVRT